MGRPLHEQSDWDQFEAHVNCMAFWAQTNLASESSVWHFHPLQFIRHYRKCWWLSANELRQLVPLRTIRKNGTTYFWESPVLGNAATNVIRNYRVALNQALNKFVFNTPKRLAAFFGNATQETAWLSRMYENNPAQSYFPWDGRGFLQLTIPSGNTDDANNNYYKYWRFLGRSPGSATQATIESWRANVADNAYDAAHSACAYWVWTGKWSNADGLTVGNSHIYGDMESPFVLVTVAVNSVNRFYYTHEGFRQAAASVNRPGSVHSGTTFNGMSERSCAYVTARMVLDDSLTFPSTAADASAIPQGYEARRP